jgi:predicted RND superfamily exporter protein
MGTSWTFGAAYFLVGTLNSNSAFLISIIIGNGINFGVIFLARYVEERANQIENLTAIQNAISGTWKSTLMAALAAGLSYGSLMLTSFRGFNQFGLIGLSGMLLCWISAYTVLPAFLMALYEKGFLRKEFKPRTETHFSRAIATLIDRWPKYVWRGSLILAGLSFLSFSLIRSEILETDLKKLRDKKSMTRGSGFNAKYITEIFHRSLSPTVILASSPENAVKISEKIRANLKSDPNGKYVASVRTLQDFIPKNQKEKLQLISEMKTLLPTTVIERLPSSQISMIRDYLTDEVSSPITQSSLPSSIQEMFKEKQGQEGTILLVEKILNPDPKWEEMQGFVKFVREHAYSVDPSAAVAGDIPIIVDLLGAIRTDGPKATLFAFLAVFGLIIVLFRNFSAIWESTLALLLGILWLSGIVLVSGIKINFLNFANAYMVAVSIY